MIPWKQNPHDGKGRFVASYSVTNEFLTSEYVDKKRSAESIAGDIGCSYGVVLRYLKLFGIPAHKTGTWLKDQGRDLSGLRVDRLLILNRHREHSKNQRWVCLCDCGKMYIALAHNLVNKLVSQCRDCSCPKLGYEEIPNAAWLEIKNGAKARHLEFTITIEGCYRKFIEQNKRCALSGESIGFALTKRAHSQLRQTTASLDRIDPLLGYIPGNIQWIHKSVNLMKHKLQNAEFLCWCRKIAKNSNGNL